MSEPTICVAPRKDGRPCRAVGTIFDPARHGLVCDAHQPGGPGSKRLKRGMRLVAEANLATIWIAHAILQPPKKT